VTGPLRQIFDAESLLRERLESNAPFEALERAAVLIGVPPEDPLARRIPRGQWIAHPAGYFIRYLPDSYSSTLVQMVVPHSAVDAVGARGVLVFDVTEELAVPANTSSQRLALTARMADGESAPCTQIQQGMPATIARGGASPEALGRVSARCPTVDQPYYTDSGESEVPSRTPANGKPNSEQEFPSPNGKTIRVYGPDGRAIKDTDYGHDHGAGDPHIHDWDWSKERPRQPGRPPKEGEIR
jgi:hypothetical protein